MVWEIGSPGTHDDIASSIYSTGAVRHGINVQLIWMVDRGKRSAMRYIGCQVTSSSKSPFVKEDLVILIVPTFGNSVIDLRVGVGEREH